MQSDIAQAVDALIKSGKEEGNALTLPGFNTVDIYPVFLHSFNEKAKAAFEVKANQLVHQYNRKQHEGPLLVMLGKLKLKCCASHATLDPKDMYVRDYDLVNFIAVRAAKENLPKAINMVITTVNRVADKGFTRAAMIKLSLVELRPADRSEPEFAVISYITLSRTGVDYVKQNMPDMLIEEGGMPLRIE